ncbi:MAG: hypothetical protein L6W00_28760 [Lentisphaeria bacterium]|nr:MAG: hypothetical protein L6W00_28760 [Lentisphaeria bacterium]
MAETTVSFCELPDRTHRGAPGNGNRSSGAGDRRSDRRFARLEGERSARFSVDDAVVRQKFHTGRKRDKFDHVAGSELFRGDVFRRSDPQVAAGFNAVDKFATDAFGLVAAGFDRFCHDEPLLFYSAHGTL